MYGQIINDCLEKMLAVWFCPNYTTMLDELVKRYKLVYDFTKHIFDFLIRCIKRAINCFHMVSQLDNITDYEKNPTLSFAYGIAGDSYMAMVQV